MYKAYDWNGNNWTKNVFALKEIDMFLLKEVVPHFAKEGTLKQKLVRELDFKCWTWNSVVDNAFNITVDLYRLHQIGMMHSDLHPENILYKTKNQSLLIDVGLAKVIANSRDNSSGSGGYYDGSLSAMFHLTGRRASREPCARHARGISNDCWLIDPSRRPTAEQIHERLWKLSDKMKDRTLGFSNDTYNHIWELLANSELETQQSGASYIGV
ncbi:hypothetical protein BC937DRAFT_89838 [Endogone sp. FLAS-F59071]|nr:hypothetical protein BC937DRAFT_89838 [Endogone sp. FLAS-F59071]|eukprot:RUS17537.1 hypothetical protein BC937DRAFT_89838 [Endogone sp. FLAS-F59071]